MIRLKDKMILYHGSYMLVEKIDLSFGNPNKDFGQGFYLTSSIEQAKRFVPLSIKKAIINKSIVENVYKGYISKFELIDIEKCNIKYFDEANVEWLHFVAGNRVNSILVDELKKYKNYDIFVGKIANDRTATTLQGYIDGLFGEIGDKQTDEMAIKTLLPNKLEDQICFKNETSINCLKYIGCEEYDCQ